VSGVFAVILQWHNPVYSVVVKANNNSLSEEEHLAFLSGAVEST
jgi:hypothetical protein